jgi:hypothetical protein
VARALRWVVAGLAAAITFIVSWWVLNEFHVPLGPRDPDKQVTVATSFATILASAVFTSVAWWAGRDKPADPGSAPASGSGSGSGERSINAGRDITGPASTGNDTINIQSR